MQISYAKPSITNLEISYVNDAITNGWGENCYDYINRFEKELCSFLGSKHVIATSSCTGAITLGFEALKLKLGRDLRVGVCDTNWVATIAPFYHSNATITLIDVDLKDWSICTEDLLRCVDQIDALVITHLYGNVANVELIRNICQDNDIILIEDCAEAIGAHFQGVHVGNFGAFGTLSFHGTKTLTTGEGGALMTNDSELFEIALTLNNHGRSRNEARQFFSSEAGFKFKMSNVQAAIGCAQLKRAGKMIEKRIQNHKIYKDLLSDTNICINPEHVDRKNVHWMINCVFPYELDFVDLYKKFNSAGIDARPFFWPLSEQNPYRKLYRKELINSRKLIEKSINVPNYFDMTVDDIERVVKTLRSI